jgi:hypothetical protein
MRMAANPIRSARHTSLAYPNRRASLRNPLGRFMCLQMSLSIGPAQKLRIEALKSKAGSPQHCFCILLAFEKKWQRLRV